MVRYGFMYAGKLHSFKGSLVMLKKHVLVATNDRVKSWFVYFWREKTRCWDAGEFKDERKVTDMLNVCWDELVKRGIIPMEEV